jgi:hypothetical protein
MQFDPDTITDVILHLRYTARDGGEELRDKAAGQFAEGAQTARRPGRQRVLLSCRRDFGDAWAAATSALGALQVKIETSLLPYWITALGMSIKKVSTLTLPLADPGGSESYVPKERWPKAPPDTAELALEGGTGTGTANLGAVAKGVTDVLLVLEAGHS